MYTYKVFEEQCHNSKEIYSSYGVEIFCGGNKIKSVPDVFCKKELAERAVKLFMAEQPDMLHFDDVLESIMQDPEYMLGTN